MGDGGPQMTCSSADLEGCIHLSKLHAAPRRLGISTRQIHSRFAIFLFFLTEFCFVDRLNLVLIAREPGYVATARNIPRCPGIYGWLLDQM